MEKSKIISNNNIEAIIQNKLNSPYIEVGSHYKGGIIAYVLNPNDPGYEVEEKHGIIIASKDQSAGIEWGCYGFKINGIQNLIGSGISNTIDIISNCPQTEIAARICYNLNLNGYSDWHLPSIYELEKLFLNLSIINENSVINGGESLTDKIYWSSSQPDSQHALALDFNTGEMSRKVKNSKFYVRAIRTF